MPWTPISELVLLWWNTSLSPPVPGQKTRASSDDIAFVISELKATFSARPFHVAGLCEVSEEDVKIIVDALDPAHFSYRYQATAPGNARVDMAIIYDADQLEFLDSEAWIDSFGRRATMKTAELVCLNARAIGQAIYIALSHWPSVRTHAEASSHRSELASSLRKRIDALAEAVRDDVFVVLMGDYNAEPFSTAIQEHLLATRDRTLAQKFPGYLYNPSWRHLGESLPFLAEEAQDSTSGTCYYAADNYRQWASFDQMMFSSSFIKSSAMVLDEQHSTILATPALRDKITSRSIFDHFPVTSTITLRKEIP